MSIKSIETIRKTNAFDPPHNIKLSHIFTLNDKHFSKKLKKNILPILMEKSFEF